MKIPIVFPPTASPPRERLLLSYCNYWLLPIWCLSLSCNADYAFLCQYAGAQICWYWIFLCINITNQLCCSCLGLYRVQCMSSENKRFSIKVKKCCIIFTVLIIQGWLTRTCGKIRNWLLCEHGGVTVLQVKVTGCSCLGLSLLRLMWMNNRNIVATAASCCWNVTHRVYAYLTCVIHLNTECTSFFTSVHVCLHVISSIITLYNIVDKAASAELDSHTVFHSLFLWQRNSHIVKSGVTGLLQI